MNYEIKKRCVVNIISHAGHWYYAYTIKGDMITIEDACHEQNMHN